jgi:hypothetical protein
MVHYIDTSLDGIVNLTNFALHKWGAVDNLHGQLTLRVENSRRYGDSIKGEVLRHPKDVA